MSSAIISSCRPASNCLYLDRDRGTTTFGDGLDLVFFDLKWSFANIHSYSIQVEGAFVQGLGWVALEELKWGDKAHKWIPPGCLVTCGPGNYKLPSLNDVPLKFNVSLLKVSFTSISSLIFRCLDIHCLLSTSKAFSYL